MTDETTKPIALIRRYWVEVVIAATVIGTAVTIWFAISDGWNADRANALAASVSGVLTLLGLLWALKQAADARAVANEEQAERRAEAAATRTKIDASRTAAEEQAARSAREVEIERRITLEMNLRQQGTAHCEAIMNLINRSAVYASGLLRDAALAPEMTNQRTNSSLDLSLRWVGDRAEIGVAALPIVELSFAHLLQREVLPEIDRLHRGAQDALKEGTDDEVLDAISAYSNDAYNEMTDRLRQAAIDNFILNMDVIRAKVDEEFPPPPLA